MDSRGPPEGAPGDPLEMSIMDSKSSEISENWPATNLLASALGDHSRKSNNRLLFLTVEYVEDQSRDYSRMFPAYEQAPFSPRAASPLSDFEHRVSPLDPNMSSTARYSPTPVPLPPLPFHNSVVVLQGPPSPLVVQPETETNASPSIDFTGDRARNESVQESHNVADFVDTGNEEELVAGVGEELILMQGTTAELEAPAPLMLAGMPGAEFALTRDFLVMQDDQINVMSTLRNQDANVDEQVAATVVTQSIVSQNENDDVSLTIPMAQSIQNDAVKERPKEGQPVKQVEQDTDKRIVRRSRRQINDKKTYWCDRCDSICHKSGECSLNNVRTIADQPVPSRAIATLPGSYLSINKLSCSVSSTLSTRVTNFGVFAKRNIRARTQFGPIEGILCPYEGTPFKDSLPLLYETEIGEFFKIDVSNENASNWMRFVRPATTYKEQNLGICQQGDGIVFLTTRNILPKEELKAGPNPEYAVRRSLKILEPETKDDREPTDSNAWPCFECNQRFSTSAKLQKHLTIHDSPKSETKSKMRRKKMTVPTNKLFKVVDGQTSLYTCPHCPKVFPRSYSLKRHLLIHPGAKSPPRYECSSCGEKFLHPRNRNRHVKMFHANDAKEKENSRQNTSEWRCATCNLTFGKSTLLSIHSLAHTSNVIVAENLDNVCPQCGEDFETRAHLINHVGKHGRVQSTKTTKLTSLASHKCNMCYKRFATKVRLQQHYLVHGAEDQKPLPCNICLKRFMNNSALSCHLKTHREDKQIFECPMCRELFNQVLMLKDHIETHRNEDETFSCPQCPRAFVKYSVIRKHIRAHHCERKHKCQFCAKRFPTVDKLRMHLLRHSDHRQFHCANCEKQFKRKDKLKEHMTRMHDSQRTKRDQTTQNNNQMKKFVPKVNPTDYNRFIYKCHQCLVGFKRRGMLVNHLAKRHPDVSPESVPELNLPILRQTRDYYCQYCDKVYKSSSKRKAHIVKNHPGAALPPSNRHKEADVPGLPNLTFSQTVGSVTTTPQGCQWCHKQYASKAKLLQHQRKKHSTLMEPADKVPRARNRPPRERTQSSNLVDGNFLISDYLQACEIDGDFLKPKMIKITADVDLVGNSGLELVGQQQFVRMRDIR